METLEPSNRMPILGQRLYSNSLIVRHNFRNLSSIWTPDDDKKRYLINKERGMIPERYLDPSVVRYKFNSLGYRTKEFDEFKDNEFMLCIGCSYTEGTGIAEEDIWHTYVGGKVDLPVMNLGYGGAGPDVVELNIMQYFKAGYPKPKIVLVQWPGFLRKIFVPERHRQEPYSINPVVPASTFDTEQRPSHSMLEKLDNDWLVERYYTYKELAYIECYRNYTTVNLILKQAGIPTFNFTFGNDFDFENNILFNSSMQIENIAPGITEEAESYDLARDCGHPGPMHNRKNAEKILPFVERLLS